MHINSVVFSGPDVGNANICIQCGSSNIIEYHVIFSNYVSDLFVQVYRGNYVDLILTERCRVYRVIYLLLIGLRTLPRSVHRECLNMNIVCFMSLLDVVYVGDAIAAGGMRGKEVECDGYVVIIITLLLHTYALYRRNVGEIVGNSTCRY